MWGLSEENSIRKWGWSWEKSASQIIFKMVCLKLVMNPNDQHTSKYARTVENIMGSKITLRWQTQSPCLGWVYLETERNAGRGDTSRSLTQSDTRQCRIHSKVSKTYHPTQQWLREINKRLPLLPHCQNLRSRKCFWKSFRQMVKWFFWHR